MQKCPEDRAQPSCACFRWILPSAVVLTVFGVWRFPFPCWTGGEYDSRVRLAKNQEAHEGTRKRYMKSRYGKRGISARAVRVGQLIKMDTMHVGLLGGEKIYCISAVDVYSRRAWFRIYTSPSAANAADLLDRISKDIDIEQIQVSGGSKFCGSFETACKQIGLHLSVLPPSSPQINGHIEPVNAMIARELLNFWGVRDDLHTNHRNLKRFLSDYHEVRTHKALGVETPNDWIKLAA